MMEIDCRGLNPSDFVLKKDEKNLDLLCLNEEIYGCRKMVFNFESNSHRMSEFKVVVDEFHYCLIHKNFIVFIHPKFMCKKDCDCQCLNTNSILQLADQISIKWLIDLQSDFYTLIEGHIRIKLIWPAENNDLNLILMKKRYKIERPIIIKTPIIQLTTGLEHVLLLDQMGHVYSSGFGNRAQLGHGSIEQYFDQPILIENLTNVFVTKIQSGLWHNLVLSDTGDLYGWGWNNDGQICPLDKMDGNNEKLIMDPTLIEYEWLNIKDPVDFVDISVGNRHSCATDCMFNHYIWGSNVFGQSCMKYQTNSSKDHESNHSGCSTILAGPWNTLSITLYISSKRQIDELVC